MTTQISSLTEHKSSLTIGKQTLDCELNAIQSLQKAFEGPLGDHFACAIDLIKQSKGRIICTGMGKSGHIARKIQATLSSIKIPSAFLHPAEALHGDLGMVVPGDTVIFFSVSGYTPELVQVAETLKQISIQSILVTASESSPLIKLCDVALTLPNVKEADPCALIPTCSSLLQLALGDMLVVTLLANSHQEADFLHFTHPSGEIGTKTRSVEELISSKQKLVKVSDNESLETALRTSISSNLGCVVIEDQSQKIIGCIQTQELLDLFLVNKNGDSLISEVFVNNPFPVVDLQCSIFKARLELANFPLFPCLIVQDKDGKLAGVVDKNSLNSNL